MGWIGRGGGMGVPFLVFNVSYIPNLNLLQSLEPFEKGSKIYAPLGNRVKFGCYTLDDLIFVSKVSIPNLSLLVSLEVA